MLGFAIHFPIYLMFRSVFFVKSVFNFEGVRPIFVRSGLGRTCFLRLHAHAHGRDIFPLHLVAMAMGVELPRIARSCCELP